MARGYVAVTGALLGGVIGFYFYDKAREVCRAAWPGTG